VLPAGVRIFLCVEPVDMRLGFDRLAQIARDRIGHDPANGGALFVFAGRAATRLKVLWFDRNALCMLYKRLHQAVFELPVATATGDAMAVHIDAAALARLLAGVPRAARSRAKNQGGQYVIA
jgi:transposase